jgi:glycosyltransferase involved in cell wall biosynthesis
MNDRPFEVVILNDYASTTGGSTAVAIASAIGLAQRGVPVTLFTCVGPVAPQLSGVRNLEVVCLGQEEIAKDGNRLRAFTSGLRNSEAERALRALLASKSPEQTLVHAHTWTKALSPFALDVVTRMGFRLVLTLHDFFIACPNGGFFVHKTRQICQRKPLSASCWSCSCDRRNRAHKLWRSVRTVVQNKVLNVPGKTSAFIGVSDFSLRILKPFLPASIPARVVRNPVGALDEGPAQIDANREFLFMGRFENEKGVRLFAEAARQSGVPALFIGDGALRPEAQRICPHGRYTGWLSPAEIRQHLRRARALVFPPLWYETLGLVVVEAAAAGVPSIVSDRCAATDFIRHGVNGLLFANGSAESLASQMAGLAADHSGAARLGRAAYDWYWGDPWSVERHVDDLLRIYGDLAGTQLSEPGIELTETHSR